MSVNVNRAIDYLRVYAKKAGVAQERITERLLAKILDDAQNEITTYILAKGKKDRSVYELFDGIMYTTDISVVSEGYAISDLGEAMAHPDAVIRAEATIDSVKQRVVRRSADMESLSQNQYVAGNDEFPVMYYENNKIFVDADAGTEPTVSLHYIRKPRTLVHVDPDTDIEITDCELHTIFDNPLMLLAEAEIEKIRDNMDRCNLLRKEAFEYINAMVSAGHRDGNVEGQMMRSRYEPERR